MNYISTEDSLISEFYNASSLTRSERRGLILHLLYTLEMQEYELSMRELIFYYNVDYGILIDSDDAIVEIVEEITAEREILDRELLPYFKNWHFNRLSILTKLILRYAVWELKKKKNDSTLVINEAVELAKGYAEKDSFRFINAVLDAWSKNFFLNKNQE